MIEKRVVLRNITLNYIAPIAQNQSFVQLGGEKFVYIPYIAPLLLLLAIIWLI
jgi:hypothetical protein